MASIFQGKHSVLLLVVVFCLGVLLSGALSYWGAGVQTIGQANLRAGSIIGPAVVGGGPRTGK